MGEDPTVIAEATDKKRYGGKGKKPPTSGASATEVDAIEEFKAAFHDKATFRIHGCNVQDRSPEGGELIRSTAREVLDAFFTNVHNWRTTRPTTVKIDMQEQFNNENDERVRDDKKKKLSYDELRKFHYPIDETFFPKDTKKESPPETIPAPLVFDKTFDQLLGFVARRLKDSYMYKAAEVLTKDTKIRVFGGLPGTSSENVEDDYLLIPSRFTRILEFCQKYLEIKTDTPVRRRYGVLDTEGVKSVAKLAGS